MLLLLLQAAVADADASCPVVQLLGYLQAPPSDEAFEMTQDPADTVWLVSEGFWGSRVLGLQGVRQGCGAAGLGSQPLRIWTTSLLTRLNSGPQIVNVLR